MRWRLVGLVFGGASLLVTACIAAEAESAGVESDAQRSPTVDSECAASSQLAFAVKLLCQEAERRPGDNLCFSPFSISSAAGLLYLGADGTTAEELARGFGFDKDKARFRITVRETLSQLTKKATTERYARFGARVVENASGKVEIADVLRGSAAHQFGLSKGDVLTAVDGVPLRSLADYANAMDMAGPLVRLAVGSPGEPGRIVTVRLAPPPPEVDYELGVVNLLLAQKDAGLTKEFIEASKKIFGAGVSGEEDFTSDAEARRRNLNDTIRTRTDGMIPELLAPGTIGPDAKLILANAIYFKAPWLLRFDWANTRNGEFKIDSTTSVTVPMMSRQAMYKYVEIPEVQIVELPYQGQSIVMDLILPRNNINDFAKEKLTCDSLAAWLAELTDETVFVSLPRFKIDGTLDLKESLSGLGIVQAFSADADLSGMTSSKDLYLSDGVHKCVMEVDEEGTSASGATALVVAARSPAPRFVADRPFLFLVRHVPSGSVLFAGRVSRLPNDVVR